MAQYLVEQFAALISVLVPRDDFALWPGRGLLLYCCLESTRDIVLGRPPAPIWFPFWHTGFLPDIVLTRDVIVASERMHHEAVRIQLDAEAAIARAMTRSGTQH